MKILQTKLIKFKSLKIKIYEPYSNNKINYLNNDLAEQIEFDIVDTLLK